MSTTLDLYGHLFPDANRSVLDNLDVLVRTSSDHPGTMEAQALRLLEGENPAISSEEPDGACGIRTRDLRLAKLNRPPPFWP